MYMYRTDAWSSATVMSLHVGAIDHTQGLQRPWLVPGQGNGAMCLVRYMHYMLEKACMVQVAPGASTQALHRTSKREGKCDLVGVPSGHPKNISKGCPEHRFLYPTHKGNLSYRPLTYSATQKVVAEAKGILTACSVHEPCGITTPLCDCSIPPLCQGDSLYQRMRNIITRLQ